MRRAIVRFLREESAATAAEYTIGAAVILLVVSAMVAKLNTSTASIFNSMCNHVGTFGTGN